MFGMSTYSMHQHRVYMTVSDWRRQKGENGKGEGLISITNPSLHYKICVLVLTKRYFYKPKI